MEQQDFELRTMLNEYDDKLKKDLETEVVVKVLETMVLEVMDLETTVDAVRMITTADTFLLPVMASNLRRQFSTSQRCTT